jgi:hypothetical protein
MSSSAQPENKCPDCLFMKLTDEPIQSRQWLQQVLERIDLYLTVMRNLLKLNHSFEKPD